MLTATMQPDYKQLITTLIMYADMTLDYLQYWWRVGHFVPLLQI